MYLLHAQRLELQDFIGEEVPPYAILSHMWGSQEVSFKDISSNEPKNTPKYRKINNCCRQALFANIQWVWVDTCCIDKSSSAELSEAINSMSKWYRNAAVCYAYLSDVVYEDCNDYRELREAFKASRWFTRGWTLQELLAPETVIFYSSTWNEIGTKMSLEHEIADAASIKEFYLSRHRHIDASVATKMSWASRRQTTRQEDMAYSLLGLFEINLPLLYGEGNKAFMRLQHAILSDSEDQSLFAWVDSRLTGSGLFALSPAAFKESGEIRLLPLAPEGKNKSLPQPWTTRNRGCKIHAKLCPINSRELKNIMMLVGYDASVVKDDDTVYQALNLNCSLPVDFSPLIMILLQEYPCLPGLLYRVFPERLIHFDLDFNWQQPSQTSYVTADYFPAMSVDSVGHYVSHLFDAGSWDLIPKTRRQDGHYCVVDTVQHGYLFSFEGLETLPRHSTQEPTVSNGPPWRIDSRTSYDVIGFHFRTEENERFILYLKNEKVVSTYIETDRDESNTPRTFSDRSLAKLGNELFVSATVSKKFDFHQTVFHVDIAVGKELSINGIVTG